MNLLKSALSGVASAVGTHYADETINPLPHSKTVYYGAAAVGIAGAIWFRNSSPILAGVLGGVGLGSAYQGYTRVGPPTLGPQMTAARQNPYGQFVTPTNVYATPRPATSPQMPAQAASDFPSPAASDFPSPAEVQKYAEQGLAWGKQLADAFGTGAPPAVPYTQEQYDADTAAFDEDYGYGQF